MTYTPKAPIILAIDDNSQNLQLVAGLLSDNLACDLCFATSGVEALDAMATLTPDLILLDVNMPGMNGYEVCEKIRASEILREIPVIFLTAQRDSDFIVRGFEAGGSDYVVKPFNGRELLARVQVQLELKFKRDELKHRNEELEEAISRIKRLEGIIPICMYCKKIRDDSSSWQQIERYITEHSEAFFSHGICPDCFDKKMAEVKSSKDG
jgi:PleD family two-component response regulator